MPEVTSYKQGTPNWVDLATTDENAALAFYSALFGWTDESMPMGPDSFYHMESIKGKYVSALYKMGPEQAGMPTRWNTYIAVDNVDEAEKRSTEAGGTTVMPPMDVFDSGRMFMAQDPTGAFIAFWQAKQHIGAYLVNEPGAVIWNELMTSDAQKAAAYYVAVLQVETATMEEMGGYTLIKVDGKEVAGIMTAPPEMGQVPPNWGVYFNTENVDESAKKAESLGGKILRPGSDIPGIGRFAVVQDPQGGVFQLFTRPTA